MAHWFHRNPLKATAQINFDLKMVVNDGQAIQLCSEMRLARNRLLDLLTDPNNDVGVVEAALNNYHSFLQGLLTAVDEKGGESKLRYALRFRWTNTMLGNTPIAQHDAVFEFISISQDYAIWLMKHAAMIAGKDDISMEEAKEVHKSLRKAAGIFSALQERYVGQLLQKPEPGNDLDTRVIQAYINQCTAEAQEVTIARAIELKHAPSLISALANETSRMYRTAADSIKGLNPRAFGKWEMYLHLKALFYLSYAYCYAGENLLAQEKCGDAIRALRESEKYRTEVGKLCKEYVQMKGPGISAKPDQHLFFRKLGSIVKLTLDKCERENGFIFHQKVPPEPPELEIKATYGLASPEDVSLPSLNPLWTSTVYAAFDIPRGNPFDAANSKAATKVEGDLPPVKEANVHQSSRDPKNNSGCILQ